MWKRSGTVPVVQKVKINTCSLCTIHAIDKLYALETGYLNMKTILNFNFKILIVKYKCYFGLFRKEHVKIRQTLINKCQNF